MRCDELFDFDKTISRVYLKRGAEPYTMVSSIKQIILELGKNLDPKHYFEINCGVWVSKSAGIAESALIEGPCIIDDEADIRHCAFIRGSVIVGKRCVVGNSTEVKNSILFDEVQVPHYNYVGDSILGYKAHLGAGAVTSNVKSDRSSVCTLNNGEKCNTGMKKLGAMIGDYVEIGCGAVLCPGSVIGRRSTIYPLVCVRGTLPEDVIYKSSGEITHKA